MTDQPTVTPVPTSPAFLTYSVPEVRWGWWDVIYGVAAFFLALTLQIVAVVVLTPSPDSADAFGFVFSLVTYAAIAAVVVVAARRKGLGSLAADFGVRFRWVDLGLGVAAGVAAKVFTFVLTAIAIVATNNTPEQGNFVLSPDPLWMVLNGVIVASLVAPFVEELFFRGLLQRSVARIASSRMGTRSGVAVAVLTSSALFALLHVSQAANPTGALLLGLTTFLFGIGAGLVAALTGRIGGAIIAHIVFNGALVLTSLV